MNATSPFVQELEKLIEATVERRLNARLGVVTYDKLVDLATVPPGKRITYRAARANEIEGARKIARRWYAPVDAYNEWLELITSRPEQKVADTSANLEHDHLADVRHRLGLKLVKR
jgi:hypothetical protein